MRIPFLLGMLVWGMVFGVGAAFALLGIFTITQSDKEADAGKTTEADALKYFGYFMFAVTAVYLLIIVFLRNKIKLAIGVVKEAARAIGSTPLLISLPVMQSAGF